MEDRSHKPEFLFNASYIPRDNFWLSFNDVLHNISTLSMALNNKEDSLFIKKIVDNTKFRLEELQKLYGGKLEKQPVDPYDNIRGVSMDGFMMDDFVMSGCYNSTRTNEHQLDGHNV